MVQYHIERHGPPDLPAILFLHGFLGSSADFRPLLQELSDSFYCLAVNLPGHGGTPAANYDIPSTARSLLAAIAQLGVEQPLGLVGYSLGGRIALYLALHYPACWTKVVLESASAGLATPAARQERQQRDLAIARQLRQPDLDFTQFIHHWYQQPVFQGMTSHPQFPALVAQRLQNNPQALARSLELAGLGSQPYLGDLLTTNQLPMLLLVGALDQKLIAINQTMAASCPAAELFMMPGCSHNVHWQQPQLWCQVVRSWFG